MITTLDKLIKKLLNAIMRSPRRSGIKVPTEFICEVI